MSDLATLASAPREIVLSCGETVRVAPLTLREWAGLQQYIKDRIPSPLAVAKANLQGVELLPDDRRAVLSAAAMIPWPPRPGSQGWLDAIARADDQQACSVAFLSAALKDIAAAERLADQLTGDDFAAVYSAAIGVEPAAPKA